MPTGIYKIADLGIRVVSIHEDVHSLCGEYRYDGPAELEIVTAQQDIDFERKKSAQEDQLENKPVRQFPDGYLETLAVYRKLANMLVHRDIMLFHGSVIAVDGQAYLFTAKSGTGKSTHTRLWRERFGARAVMINDDKPLLRITEQGITAYGTPWNGKHRLGINGSAPLKAICILERGAENKIRQVSAVEALPMLLQQSHRPGDGAGKGAYLDLLDKMTGQVRFYKLACNMDPEAAQVAFDGMKG